MGVGGCFLNRCPLWLDQNKATADPETAGYSSAETGDSDEGTDPVTTGPTPDSTSDSKGGGLAEPVNHEPDTEGDDREALPFPFTQEDSGEATGPTNAPPIDDIPIPPFQSSEQDAGSYLPQSLFDAEGVPDLTLVRAMNQELEALMNGYDLSQRQFANRFGLTRSYLSLLRAFETNWQAGDRTPPKAFMDAILDLPLQGRARRMLENANA